MQERSEDQSGRAEVYHRLGGLTRQLHDALAELGHTDKLKGSAEQLPDTQSRLAYIARLTGEAAEKVLTQVEGAKMEQVKLADRGRRLTETVAGVPGLAAAMPELVEWASDVTEVSERIDTHLTEIMMAQDFHDLTGQVIGRVVKLAAAIEDQLLALLLHSATTGKPGQDLDATPKDELSGPVVDPEGRGDVASDQQQVDDLLASMGF